MGQHSRRDLGIFLHDRWHSKVAKHPCPPHCWWRLELLLGTHAPGALPTSAHSLPALHVEFPFWRIAELQALGEDKWASIAQLNGPATRTASEATHSSEVCHFHCGEKQSKCGGDVAGFLPLKKYKEMFVEMVQSWSIDICLLVCLPGPLMLSVWQLWHCVMSEVWKSWTSIASGRPNDRIGIQKLISQERIRTHLAEMSFWGFGPWFHPELRARDLPKQKEGRNRSQTSHRQWARVVLTQSFQGA